LRQTRDAERARKTALAGPHRDDVGLSLDDVSLAAYGSQGQQRTAVLALKIAEYAVMKERSNEAPLLLLDDVLSELDEERATAFLAEIGDYEQSFVTATHLPAPLQGERARGVRPPRARGGACGMLKLSQAIVAWAPSEKVALRDPLTLLAAGLGRYRRRRSRGELAPVRVADGTLVVVTRSSAWSHQLSFLAERVLGAVAARLPGAGVERLRFRVGVLPKRSAPRAAGGAPPSRAAARRTRSLG
jgi:hypothetical protein